MRKFLLIGFFGAVAWIVAVTLPHVSFSSIEQTVANLRAEADASRAEVRGDYASARQIRERAQLAARRSGGDPRTTKAEDLKLEKFTWRISDRVGVATFTVHSNNSFPLKDIEFTCDTYGRGGTLLSHLKTTSYEVIPAKTTKVFKEVNLGQIDAQSASMNCSVTGAS